MQYLLPCECGQKIPLSTGQAGDTLTCECGRTVTAPKLREMRLLEPAPEPKAGGPPRASWSPIQGALYATGGGIVALAALALLVVSLQRSQLQTEAPPLIPDKVEEYLGEIDRNTPLQNLEIWKNEVLDEGLKREGDPIFVTHQRADAILRKITIAAGSVGAFGMALIVAAFVVRPKRP